MGTAIGGAVLLASHDPVLGQCALAGTVMGNVTPDIPTFGQWALDKFYYKRPVFSGGENQPFFLLTKETSHSFVIELLLLIGLQYQSEPIGTFFVALSLGMILHTFIDCLTHCDPIWNSTDNSCIWPIYPYFTKLKLGEVMGIEDYRYSAGELFHLKPFEKVVLIASVVITIATFGAYFLSAQLFASSWALFYYFILYIIVSPKRATSFIKEKELNFSSKEVYLLSLLSKRI